MLSYFIPFIVCAHAVNLLLLLLLLLFIDFKLILIELGGIKKRYRYSIERCGFTHVSPRLIMVEIRDGFDISESKCLGISPGRDEFEIICSFCNGLIAIYNVGTIKHNFIN